jgi:hypothetical protein
MPAPSSPSSGLTTEPLGRGITLGGLNIDANRVKLSAKDAVEFAVARLTFAPGATTGWQLPAGPVLVIVTSGTLTRYDAGDGTAQTFTAGQTFVLCGPCDQNMLRNEGTVPTETIVTFITPAKTDQTTTRRNP